MAISAHPLPWSHEWLQRWQIPSTVTRRAMSHVTARTGVTGATSVPGSDAWAEGAQQVENSIARTIPATAGRVGQTSDDELADQGIRGWRRAPLPRLQAASRERASSRLVTLLHAIGSTGTTAWKEKKRDHGRRPVSSVSDEDERDVLSASIGLRERRGNRPELRRGGLARRTQFSFAAPGVTSVAGDRHLLRIRARSSGIQN